MNKPHCPIEIRHRIWSWVSGCEQWCLCESLFYHKRKKLILRKKREKKRALNNPLHTSFNSKHQQALVVMELTPTFLAFCQLSFSQQGAGRKEEKFKKKGEGGVAIGRKHKYVGRRMSGCYLTDLGNCHNLNGN